MLPKTARAKVESGQPSGGNWDCRMQNDYFRSILVVDDEDINRDLIQESLLEAGYVCVVASDADQALETLSRMHFDLVVCDIVMEGKDGISLMKEARGSYPHLQFIIMTGYSDLYSYSDIIGAGATDYVTKPFSMSDLVARLERIRWQKWTEEELRKYQDQLEALVNERTKRLELEIKERQRAEEAAKAAERKYRTIFENSLMGIYQSTPAGKYITVNQAFAEILGYDSPDDLTSSITNIAEQVYINPYERQQSIPLLHGTGAHTFEVELKRKDGSTAWIANHVRVVRDDEGTILYYEGVAEDIADRKRAEEALRESEARFRKFAEEASFEGILFHHEGRILDVNENFARMSGYARGELIGMSLYELVASESRSLVKAGLDTQDKAHYEAIGLRKDGSRLPVEVHAKDITYCGRMARAAAVRDISERKRSEQALQAANQQLLDIIDFLPDATVVIDLQGAVIAWNRAIEEMTGIRKEDILGKGDHEYALPFYGKARTLLVDLVLKADAELEKSYDHIERRGNTIYAEAYVPGIRGGKGGYMWGTASPLFDRDGSVIGAIESIRDISERKEMESALREREKELGGKSLELQETNTALRVLLKRREEDQKEFGANVLSNMKELVFPYLQKLGSSRLDEMQRTYLGILESHLEDISAPFLRSLSTEFSHLSPMELQVAGLIKAGKRNKEISEILGLSLNTILTHRYHLRTKLGLKNKDANLVSYLKSIK